ncbi:MAG: hypothetical protein R2856_03250 [Caldilineaceae bacterium]
MIASRVGGLAHLVQRRRQRLPRVPQRREALAARILHLLTDEAHRRQLGDQAQV